MTHGSEHAHPTTTRNALVKTADGTALPPLPVSGPRSDRHLTTAERRTRTDPRTHAKSVYERDPSGREVYATYYNSNDDPTFQERYNKNGGTFVTTSCFTFVSNGASGDGARQHSWRSGQAAPHMRAPIVEEEPVEEVDARHDRDESLHRQQAGSRRSRTTASAQPIVEEPDDDGYVKMESVQRDPHRHPHRHHRPPQEDVYYDEQDPWGDRALMQLMSPHGFARPRAFPPSSQQQLSPFARGGLFADDLFFGGAAHNPFRMMDAMHQHMAQQRAAMFGGVDPFGAFF